MLEKPLFPGNDKINKKVLTYKNFCFGFSYIKINNIGLLLQISQINNQQNFPMLE